VGFKQRAIIEFLVTEKELVTDIHKRLKSLYGVNAVDKSTISLWASRTAGFAKGQVELTDARRFDWPTTAVTQRCFNILIKSFKTTDPLQTESLKFSTCT